MLEFIEEEHLYLKDGILIPSVSEILHFIFPDKYKCVDLEILRKKANYGSLVHEAVECLEQDKILPKLDNMQRFSIEQYQRLKRKYNIDVKVQEQMIHYKSYYAGRFDMIATINDRLCLCDIKTTAVLDKEYLSWQLSFYELAYTWMYGINLFEKLYAIWLPKKGYGELVEIERKSVSDMLQKLNEFRKNEKI